jgi:hypothetical protein
MSQQKNSRISDPLVKLFKAVGITDDMAADGRAIAERSGIYYHALFNKFFVPRSEGGYASVPWSGCKAALQASGIATDGLKDDMLGAVRAALISQFTIDGCFNLAGHPTGLVKLPDGARILVERGMTMIEAADGDPTPILDLIHGLLGGNQTAIMTLLSWLKIAVLDGAKCKEVGVVEANTRPSQALIIVGPPGSGKSLLIKLVGDIFGGKRADPYPYMSGATAFNADLATAVLLVMDDVTESVLPRARHSLAQHLRQFTVNPYLRVHAKGVQAFTAQTFQRIVMLANEDSLNVLPAMEPDFIDKVHVFQAFRTDEIAANRDDAARSAWMKRLTDALPAFVRYLSSEFVIPPDLQDGRFGVKAYHDKHLMSELRNEENYLELLGALRDQYVYRTDTPPVGKITMVRDETDWKSVSYVWEGTSHEFHALVHDLPERLGWRKDFSSSHATGMILKRMADQIGERVQRGKEVRGSRRWIVDLGGEIGDERSEDDPGVKGRRLADFLDREKERRRQAREEGGDDDGDTDEA